MSSINVDETVPIEETETLVIEKKISDAIKKAADGEGIEVEALLSDVFGDGFYVATQDIGETVVTLKYVDPWSETDKTVQPKSSDGEETPATLKTYRRLRDEFPPVTAGIEYSKSFTAGGGFEVDIEDPDNEHQQETKKIINELNRNLYQDEVTRGLDAILDILIDEAFTVGCSAAEIVYDKFKTEPPDVTEYLTPSSEEDVANGTPVYVSNDLTKEEWKELGGIVQLKMVDDAVQRMKPYRHPTTYKIEYWTVDEETIMKENEKRSKESLELKEVPILLPWQVLWLSWDRRGSNVKGNSLIRPVAKTAVLLEEIYRAIGISQKKWADKKYFFILGSDKTGRSWAPPKVTNFLRDVKKMTTEGGTGIAVPSGFDIKDIGGELYEGDAIINHLISMICAGMRYPQDFLSPGKTQASDTPWLAWIVTYASHQKLLRRAIEHQLWERHLYTVFGGTTIRVSRQGQKLENQPLIPIYVPKMSWKSEGKWHIKQKIEELTKILNVANPVSPELKLEVESDIAVTLGYSELSLENARDILKMRQKINVIEAEADQTKAEILKEVMEKALKDKEFKDSIVPIIQGTSQKPDVAPPPAVGGNPKRPLPVPLKRLAGGVSRFNKDTAQPNAKEMAKSPGDTRQPKPNTGTIKTQESEEGEETIQFESYDELIRTSLKMSEHNSKIELYGKMMKMLDNMIGDED
jgi:hypothetical protein